jgi:hypothetical protein
MGQGLSWENQYKWNSYAMMQLSVHVWELGGRNVEQNTFHTKLLNDYHIYHYNTVPCAPLQTKLLQAKIHRDNQNKIV